MMRYSKLDATLKGTMLTVACYRARGEGENSETIDVATVDSGSTKALETRSKSFHYNNKILLVEPISGTEDTLVVYTDNGRVYVYRHGDSSSHPLSRFINVRSKVFFVGLSKYNLRLMYVCCVINKYKLAIKEMYFTIGDDVKRRTNPPVFAGGINPVTLLRKGLFTQKVALRPLLDGEPQINSSIGLSIVFEDDDKRIANHFLTRGNKRYTNRTKWYYAPLTQTRRNDFSISIRRNGNAGLSIVRRRMEEVEKTLKFRFYESVVISFLLYHLAHIVRKLSKVQVNLYFEKLAGQAEEGAIDVFRNARDHSKKSKNFFIIRDSANVYSSIKNEPGVVCNFTLRSYWLMYRANNVIATEVPQHMNILRSGNRYARRAPYSQTFVFLQHGVTYLKPQDKTTSFKKGREGEPDYMVVNSRKERDITSDMLNIEEERFIMSGMPIFDTIKHNHITKKSPDIVTIMLTWKPYEEHLQDFTKSTYYRSVVRLYKTLQKYTSDENIRIIAHPKFKSHMIGTDMEKVLWKGLVSEALNDTKLVITDYSSVCYNVFYQGGAVIFFQPDLEVYQQATGTLIPYDTEYIGERVFDIKSIDTLLQKGIGNGVLDLGVLRTEKHNKNYNSINEFHDSKNIERLYDWLSSKGIV